MRAFCEVGMRSVAASFSTVLPAEDAVAVLRDVLHLHDSRLRVGRLGHASYPVPDETVVAGAFDGADIAAVVEIVESYGGRIVADVGTSRT